ncbi:uncharacterized protein LOC131670461 isoform X2 [Phymastichus coffea]|uniref:uncharacterized protein LOC131670461 isoform X2 n=1 Tax=Phymastichus coffea TaxID=108790 RepID=UPI00273CD60C|nr:uncharacterized protein LOC131670461 isoform X2 [Phymastichus coffea]
MDATIRCQFDVIMDNFKEIKYKHTCLEEEYKTMELLYIKQKERIGELESYRNQLIKLLRKQMDKANTFKTTVESLQKENNNLNATIQDQNLLLNEYSTTIDQLKKENTLWKNKCNKPKNVSDKRIQKPNKNSVNSNFSHPSFINNSSPTSVTKLKKKSPLVLPNSEFQLLV